MRKVIANNPSTNAQLESGQLQDVLNTMGTKKVNVKIGGQTYGIIDIVTDKGQAILLAEKDAEGVTAKWLARELGDTLGQDIFIEIDGKLISAKDVTGTTITARKKKASFTEAVSTYFVDLAKKATSIVTGVNEDDSMQVESAKKVSRGDDVYNPIVNLIGKVLSVEGEVIRVLTVKGKCDWLLSDVQLVEDDDSIETEGRITDKQFYQMYDELPVNQDLLRKQILNGTRPQDIESEHGLYGGDLINYVEYVWPDLADNKQYKKLKNYLTK